jgi:hypothetical protein
MNLKEAKVIVGTGLGNPSKMPGHSFGLSALDCKTGSKLRKIEGSVCANCYAMKGCYQWPGVKSGHKKRLKASWGSDWQSAMVRLIGHYERSGYFRIHDSGDFQSADHVLAWFVVCRRLPKIRFWVPSRERRFIKEALRQEQCPKNLIIRVSDNMVDKRDAPGWATHTSGVVSDGSGTCHASHRGGACGDCRRCWDKRVKRVTYNLH